MNVYINISPSVEVSRINAIDYNRASSGNELVSNNISIISLLLQRLLS
jgi:hypothetical protein